jgi:Glycosyltransferase
MIRVAYVLGKVHSGGKKNLVLEYLRHVDNSKVTIDFICDSDSNSIPEEEVLAHNGKVYRITPYQNIVGNMRDMLRIFRKNKYDVVHAWNSTMNLFSMVLAKKAGITVRISESLSMAYKHEFKTYIKYALRPFSIIDANYYMACGEDCGIFQFGQKAFDNGKIAIFKTIINASDHPYNPELRNVTRETFGWNGNVVYGFIGRYMSQKNPMFIIDIFNEIQKRQQNAKLVLIGFGGLEDRMMKRVKEHGIQDKVENLGKREDIKQFYNAFDAFLLPSLYEGLPVVGLESQSCGLPIFFSTEITPEAAACDLAVYTSLKESASAWAEKIIPIVEKNIPTRKTYSEDIEKAGFDSHSESIKMQEYYFNAIKEQNGK